MKTIIYVLKEDSTSIFQYLDTETLLEIVFNINKDDIRSNIIITDNLSEEQIDDLLCKERRIIHRIKG